MNSLVGSPGEGDDTRLPPARAASTIFPVVPATQSAVGLVTEPGPRDLDRHVANVTVAGLADALVVTRGTALVVRRGHTGQTPDLPSVVELAPAEKLRDEHPSTVLADSIQQDELPDLLDVVGCGGPEEFASIPF